MSQVRGFAEAQAAYENQHPDDNLCPCHAEHESRGCDGGYDLGGNTTCDHEACHQQDDWWHVRDHINSGLIENETELAFAQSLLGEEENLTESAVTAALFALGETLHRLQEEANATALKPFKSCIVGLEEVTR